MTVSPSRTLRPEQVRKLLVSHLGLARFSKKKGAAGVRETLTSLRCIQLDPLDPLGTNADLVAMARVPGLARGDVYAHLLPGHAFEHFAKERCLLPASAFPFYRMRATETPWWRLGERTKRISPALIEAVLEEVRERGPLTAAALTERGQVVPLDYSGWKGTTSAATMAIEILWTRCQVIVCGRIGKRKIFDVPERALAHACTDAVEPFERWAVAERARAAGLLALASGPHWSMLKDARTSPVVKTLVTEGVLECVQVEGSARPYLVDPAMLAARPKTPDDTMRLLGPLDPLVWNRELVRQVFDFDYVWEVYKPASLRKYGWYVCPLLHRGLMVGRLAGRVAEGTLTIDDVWEQKRGSVERSALRDLLERHALACGATRIKAPPRYRIG